MTPEEVAFNALAMVLNTNAYIGICEANDLVVACVALDKQIPKKPEKEAEDNLLCPACSGFLGYESDCKEEPYQLPYCSGCGQAIDWTDWEK